VDGFKFLPFPFKKIYIGARGHPDRILAITKNGVEITSDEEIINMLAIKTLDTVIVHDPYEAVVVADDFAHIIGPDPEGFIK
jgi:hypothetical protein